MKIKTEDLRAGLNDFSPEQQIEKEAKAIDASAKTLADVSKVLADIVYQIGDLTSRMEKANVIRISSKTKAELASMAVQVVDDASKVLETRVNETVVPFAEELKRICQQISERERRFSIPIPVVCGFMGVFVCCLVYVGIVVYANYRIMHSAELWTCTWLMLATMVFWLSVIVFLSYKKWL